MLICVRLKPRRISFDYFFALKSDGRKDGTASAPIVIALRAASTIYIPTIRPTFGWLLCAPSQQKPPKSEAPSSSLFYFFSSLHSSPKTTSERPPPRVPPVRISSPMSLPPPTPSFVWLLHISLSSRHPRPGAPPLSQYSDGRHFGAPNKGTKRSAREPGRRAPPIGSWGAAAPRFGSIEDVSVKRAGKAGGR